MLFKLAGRRLPWRCNMAISIQSFAEVLKVGVIGQSVNNWPLSAPSKHADDGCGQKAAAWFSK
jgi:hypothetical protein